jgi:hypothetical protein
MKTFNEIDVFQELSYEDFQILFNGQQLPLNESEKLSIEKEYYPMYKMFFDAGVGAEGSWLAIRNLFIMKNSQIAKRIINK